MKRTCKYCKALNPMSMDSCMLQFKVEHLKDPHVMVHSLIDSSLVWCKPAEECPKPKTNISFCEWMSVRFPANPPNFSPGKGE